MAESGKALILLSLSALCAPSAFCAPGPVATVASISGKAVVRRAADAAAARVLVVNDTLLTGDIVATIDDSSLKLLFSDDTIIDLGPTSQLKIDQYEAMSTASERKALLTVLYGRLRALVTKAIGTQSKFEVRTATAYMGVRGTEFIVNSPREYQGGGATAAGRTDVTVITGTVALGLPREPSKMLPVTAGMLASTIAGQRNLPSPQLLTAGELTRVTGESRMADNTFVRTVSADAAIRNDKAPSGTTSLSVAATAASSEANSPSLDAAAEGSSTSRSGLLGGTPLTDVPITRIPGNFQTVTVRLSH